MAHEIDFYRMYKVGPTAMALLTPDLEIIDMNDEFQAYVGRPVEEVAGRNIFEITPKMPEDCGGAPIWAPLVAGMTYGTRAARHIMRAALAHPDHPGAFLARIRGA